MNRRVNETLYELCGEPGVCAYCGDVATQIDHTVPVSFLNQKPEIGRMFNLMKVHSCTECNCMASDFLQQTFFERRLFISGGFIRKHKKQLRTANWSDDEIAEMGVGMRSYIAAATEYNKILKRRLKLLGSSDLPNGIRDDLWEPRTELLDGEWTGPNHSTKASQIQQRTEKMLNRIFVAERW